VSDKESTLELLDKEYQNLREAVDGLDDEQMTRVWLGEWSVKDIVAHVLGWEREMTGALQRLARGERPTPEGVDYSDVNEWNHRFARKMTQIDPRTVLAAWRQAHMNYLRAAKAVPDDRFGLQEDGRPKTVNRLLEASGFGHYGEHAPQVREWRQREGL
jgi:uncharacterized protein (TIGR03083 family)